jgi:hypothetical protein
MSSGRGVELDESGGEYTSEGPGEQHCNSATERGELIAVGVGIRTMMCLRRSQRRS